MTENNYNIIKKLIGFITIVVGILLLLKTEHERNLAIITTDGILGGLNIIWGAFALFALKEGGINRNDGSRID